jgi:hypothetical protein
MANLLSFGLPFCGSGYTPTPCGDTSPPASCLTDQRRGRRKVLVVNLHWLCGQHLVRFQGVKYGREGIWIGRVD